jgi:hypothetical protein
VEEPHARTGARVALPEELADDEVAHAVAVDVGD